MSSREVGFIFKGTVVSNDPKDKVVLLLHGSELIKAAEHAFYSMEKVYVLLNHIASGEHMKQWARVDPQAVLGQVYGDLAPCFFTLKTVLEKMKGCAGTQSSINGANKS